MITSAHHFYLHNSIASSATVYCSKVASTTVIDSALILRKMAGVSLVRVWIKLCVIVVLFTVASSVAQSNILYQVNATGSAVVLQAIGRLQQSGVFGNDNELLRRIAYVEARDGTLTNASTDGGIWAVRESKFLQTQDLEANIQLPAILTQIQNIFGIDWMSVQWRDLRMPLYSMIAARLVLYLTPQAIPPSNDLEAQVMFWVQYYNPDGDEDDFIGVSRALQGIMACVTTIIDTDVVSLTLEVLIL